MTALVRSAAARFHFSTFSFGTILRFNRAYIEYRKFKSMDADQMKDLGIDAAQVDSVTFADFL